jgi:hypothetical protein
MSLKIIFLGQKGRGLSKVRSTVASEKGRSFPVSGQECVLRKTRITFAYQAGRSKCQRPLRSEGQGRQTCAEPLRPNFKVDSSTNQSQTWNCEQTFRPSVEVELFELETGSGIIVNFTPASFVCTAVIARTKVVTESGHIRYCSGKN